MNKTLLVACSSMLALSGCAMVLDLTKDRRVHEREAEDFEFRVTQRFDAAVAAHGNVIPESLEELRTAYRSWISTYRSIEMFREADEYAYTKIGTCESPKRKTSKHCKEARAIQGRVALKIAALLHASIDQDPEPGSAFPAQAITEAQAFPDIAAAVDVEPSITKLVEQWSTYWSRRVKKAGGAANLVRKEGTGMCFLSEAPHGKDIKPRFALSSETEDVFVRCIAADAFRSYERTQQDTVHVSLISGLGDDDDDNFFSVKEIPIDDISTNESMDLDVSASLFHKKIKSTLLSKDLKQRYKNWRYIVVDVQYVVAKKVGVKERYSNSDRLELVDDIRAKTVARGYAVLKLDGDGPKESDDDDEPATSDDDTAAPERAKPSKVVAKKHTARAGDDDDDDDDSDAPAVEKKRKKRR